MLKKIINLIASNGTVTEQDVAEKLGISIEEAEEKLRILVAIGYLKQSEDAPRETKKQLRARIAQLEQMLAMANEALHSSVHLIEELSGDNSTYMVSVDGQHAPRFEHMNIESARNEAERIAGLVKSGTIRILSVVDVLNVRTTETKTTSWASDVEEKTGDDACNGQCEGCAHA